MRLSRFGLLFAGFALLGSVPRLTVGAAQVVGAARSAMDGAVVNWARDHAISIATVEGPQDSHDLQPLKQVIADAHLITLGESSHGIHEFLAFRNRLFEFLVDEMGFTAIAVETGFVEGTDVDNVVSGRSTEHVIPVQEAFSYLSTSFEENRELLEWIQRRNAVSAQKVHFYGIDMTNDGHGSFGECRSALQGALASLARIDSRLATQFGERLNPLLGAFTEREYATLTVPERTIFTEAVSELVGVFQRRRADFLAVMSAADYEIAFRQAVVARQADAYIRASPPTAFAGEVLDFRAAEMGREAAMADNVRWLLAREGQQGRVLVYAHSWHTMKDPLPAKPNPLFPRESMGQILERQLARDMVAIGFAPFQREGNERGLTPDEINASDREFSVIGSPFVFLDLRVMPRTVPFKKWWSSGEQIASGGNADSFDPVTAFDAVMFIDHVTEAHRAQ